jgi:hypothetical protein
MRLPLDAPTARTRRLNAASGYHDLRGIDKQIDLHLNLVKEKIQYRLSYKSLDVNVNLQAIRQAGLVRLMYWLESNHLALDVCEILHGWLVENDRLRSLRAALQDRLSGRRRWLYRNVATFLTKTYSIIGMEDEFAAREMIEDRISKDQDLPFRRSIKHYQWAAVAELRRYIIEAAAKNGARIVEVKTRWSTTTCSICEQYTPHQPSLKLICPNGHAWDQDINASTNILKWLKTGIKLPEIIPVPSMVLPNILHEILVPI